ncbi:MAG: hypothetical protein LBQ14_06495 [Treponema sp.]|jgi:class 3 adenylate cyclase|nr:hypothetical protein [Treponema sp.]
MGIQDILPNTSSPSIELDESAQAALKKMPVDIFDGLYLGETKAEALILCIDIRNFSNFLCDNDENAVFALIKEFSSNFLSCINQLGYNCSYYKLVGDGAIVIWDEAAEDQLREALAVFDTFSDFLNEDLFVSMPGLGLAGALVLEKIFKYEISAEVAGLKYRDYIGYGINLACRLQTLAEKDQLIINQKLAVEKKVPYKLKRTKKLLHKLEMQKGLQAEDRSVVYLYTPGSS